MASRPPSSAHRAWHPPCQHPRQGTARESRAEPDAGDRMPERRLSDGHHHALSRWVLRCVGWLKKDVEALEMLPHRVRPVRQPAARERVRGEEIAELVVGSRLRHPQEQRNRRARSEGQRADQARGEQWSRGQASPETSGGPRRGPDVAKPDQRQRQEQETGLPPPRPGPNEEEEDERGHAAGDDDPANAPTPPAGVRMKPPPSSRRATFTRWCAHRRPMLRRLTRKPARIVCTPSAVSVAPGG